jgi:hypothetical protein
MMLKCSMRAVSNSRIKLYQLHPGLQGYPGSANKRLAKGKGPGHQEAPGTEHSQLC